MKATDILRRVPRILASVLIVLAASAVTGAETINVPFDTCGGVSTSGQYSGLVQVTFSGYGVTTPGDTLIDAFYALDPNDPSVSLGESGGGFRFSRASQGGCTCDVSCAGQNEGVESALVDPV